MFDNLPEGPITKLLDLTNNLIDKLSSAIGWTITNNSKFIAKNVLIDDIKNRNIDPIQKAALISNSNKIIKEYTNQHNIVEIANSFIKDDTKINNVDDDWLAMFMDKARLVSDKEFQNIWGKILAEECSNPNTIPKALLQTLEIIDRNDALNFSKIRSMSVEFIDIDNNVTISPVIDIKSYSKYCKNIGLQYDDFVSLASLGLIECSFSTPDIYSVYPKNNIIKIKYFDEEYTYNPTIEDCICGNVIFTKTGQALAKAISPTKFDDYFNDWILKTIKPIKKRIE